MNANPLGVFLVLSAIYFAVTLVQASSRLFWFDEFITLYIAKLDSVTAIWNALANGVDPNPPLTHFLVMWSMRIFGEGEIAVRLPSILAGWTGMTCLYLFLRGRLPVLYATVGVLFFMATAAFDYSFEGRSYALTLAFAIMSLLAWRLSIESSRPRTAAVALALALAAGISSNYYAVLAFFPIAAGELLRTIESRRITYRIWIALAAGAAPLFFYMPLVDYAIAKFAPHAFNRPRPQVIADSYVQMVAVNLVPALLILLIGVAVFLFERWRGQRLTPRVLPRHEVVAVLVLLAYPILGYCIALIRAGMISPRFVLPVCYGFAIAVAVLSFKLFFRSRVAGVALLALLFISFIGREAVIGYWFHNQREAVFRVRDRLPATDTTVVSDSLLVLPLHYYSPPQLASRIVFPVDFDAIRRYKKEDSPEQNLWAGRDIFPVPIVPLKDFQRHASNYIIVTTETNWLVQELAATQAEPQQLAIPTETQAIGGFFPLSHGEIHYFENGDAVPEIATRGRSLRPDSPTGRTSK